MHVVLVSLDKNIFLAPGSADIFEMLTGALTIELNVYVTLILLGGDEILGEISYSDNHKTICLKETDIHDIGIIKSKRFLRLMYDLFKFENTGSTKIEGNEALVGNYRLINPDIIHFQDWKSGLLSLKISEAYEEVKTILEEELEKSVFNTKPPTLIYNISSYSFPEVYKVKPDLHHELLVRKERFKEFKQKTWNGQQYEFLKKKWEPIISKHSDFFVYSNDDDRTEFQKKYPVENVEENFEKFIKIQTELLPDEPAKKFLSLYNKIMNIT